MAKNDENKAEKNEDKNKAEEKQEGEWGTNMGGSSEDY